MKLVIDLFRVTDTQKLYPSKTIRQFFFLLFYICATSKKWRQIEEQWKPRRVRYEFFYFYCVRVFLLLFSRTVTSTHIKKRSEKQVKKCYFHCAFSGHTLYMRRLNGVDVIYMFLSQLQNANNNNGRRRKKNVEENNTENNSSANQRRRSQNVCCRFVIVFFCSLSFDVYNVHIVVSCEFVKMSIIWAENNFMAHNSCIFHSSVC